MIILIGGEKGGTGKTTIAVNAAALRARAGHDVLLVDTDLQGSASAWAALRDEQGIKERVACIQKFGKGLQNEIKDLAERYDDVIIDAGGRDSIELRAALVVATRAYIPVQASQFDIWTLERMNEIVATAQGFNPGLVAHVVVSRVTPNPSVTESQDAVAYIAELEHLRLAKSVVRDRIAFRRSVREGRGVMELQPNDDKAVGEITQLYKEIFNEN